MKTIKLKVEGNEKIKFHINVEFDEVTVILFKGGTATKYFEKLMVNIGENEFYYDGLVIVMEKLYKNYLRGLETEEDILKIFEDKHIIEFPDSQ